jgi:hypothetical protein
VNIRPLGTIIISTIYPTAITHDRICDYYYHYSYILNRPSVIDPDDRLIFVLSDENVFMIDFILAKVDSFEGVKNADVYILTKLQYYNDWIIREIDERLVQRLLSHKSIKAAGAFMV